MSEPVAKTPRFTLTPLKGLAALKGNLTQDAVRLLMTCGVFAAVFLLFHFDALTRFELVTYDYRMILRGEREADPRIVVVEISDDSVAKIGRWPWDRDWHATLIQILHEAGAKAIAFDVIFSEPSDPQKDYALAESIRRSGRVYLAEVFEESERGHSKLLTSMPQFAQNAKGAGHINLQPDVDGVMRRIPLYFGQTRLPQLSVSMAADELGVDADAIHAEGSTLVMPVKGQKRAIRVPLDEDRQFMINWVGRWRDSFTHYSYIDVVTSYAAKQKGQRPVVSLEGFKDKLVYVGTTASGLFDIRPTPLEPSYPAVGVNLTILNNLLEQRFIRPLYYFENFAILVLYMVLLYHIMKLQSYFKAAFYTALVAIGHVGLSVLLFSFAGLWANIIYPLLLISMTYFVVTLYNQLSIAIERAKLLKLATRDSLTGLFNIGHFKLLLKAEITTISLRREKNLSIVMGDVDNFKKTNDTYGHVTGDSVLKEVAGCVRSNCRALDVAARYGGEEFILMLPGANVDQAFKVAENIRKAVEQKIFFHEKGDFRTSISIGVTQVSPDDKDLEAIVARADRALYEAKHTGKNRVCIAADSPKVSI